MMLLALIVAGLSGALAALLVCKGIQLRLWADVLAGLGSLAAMYLAGRLAGADGWPMAGFLGGYGAVVAWLRLRPRHG
jgi:uncharacterized membrane protein YeaQ/YmgE (transglycosylase-associated protein family)